MQLIGRGIFDRTPKDPIRRIKAKVKEIEVVTMGITTERVTMLEMETTTTTTISTRVTMVSQTIGVGPMFHLKMWKLLLGMVDVVWRELRICCRR